MVSRCLSQSSMPRERSAVSKALRLCTCLAILFSVSLPLQQVAGAAKRDRGEKLYAENCSACHYIGKNIIKPEKTIIASDKLKTAKEFKAFLARAHGQMPAYKTIVRNDKDLQALYRYIKLLNSRS